MSNPRFYSDVHIGWKLYNRPELAEDLKTLFAQEVDRTITDKASHFVVVGDLYDGPNPPEELVIFVTEQVKKLVAAGVVPVGIAGDHDCRPNTDQTWINDVNGFERPSGIFAGCGYKNFLNVPDYCSKVINPEQVEFLLFHGQDETLFKFVEEKKRLNLNGIDFSRFPNLKAIILGDIHLPMNGVIKRPELGLTIPIEYCSSIGVIKSNEIGTKTGALAWDGKKLVRLPVAYPRVYAKITLPDDTHLINDMYEALKREKNQPLLLVTYGETTTKETIDSLKAFEEFAYVRFSQIKKTDIGEETINIRQELATNKREELVLNKLMKSQPARELLLQLLHTTDQKVLLDQYKDKILL